MPDEHLTRIMECVFDITQEADCYLSGLEERPDSRELFSHIAKWAADFESSITDKTDYLPDITQFALKKLNETYHDLYVKRTDNIIRITYDTLDSESGISKTTDNTYETEIYPDYDESLDTETTAEIMQSENPEHTLSEKLDARYWNYKEYVLNNLTEQAADNAREKDLSIDESDEQVIRETIENSLAFKLPVDFFMKQECMIDILIDTGDGDTDYTMNCVQPAWEGSENIDPEASLTLLAGLQGYSRYSLQNALNKGDAENPANFLESVRQEVANESGRINALLILARMTLNDACKLNGLIRKASSEGFEAHPYKRTYNGTITISKDAESGLFDIYNGGGSVFEIKLEKDMNVPIKYIRQALPDSESHFSWSVKSVYGTDNSLWKDCVLSINP